VIERIRANYVPLFCDLGLSTHWARIWDYNKLEKSDGLRWLISRRNLLTHSIHLEALATDDENEIFDSAFNHLDESARRKLKPETPELELKVPHSFGCCCPPFL
jgi:hypothetical protein